MYDEKSTHELTYKIGTVLAVSINPDDKVQQFLTKDRVSDFYTYYKSKFERMDPKHFDHWFRIEISEPIGTVTSEGPRLHLHGVIKLKTRIGVYKWLIDIMPDLLQHARLQIDQCPPERIPGWLKYCIKQAEIVPDNFWLSNFSGSPKGETVPCLSPARGATSLSPAGAGEREGGECDTKK